MRQNIIVLETSKPCKDGTYKDIAYTNADKMFYVKETLYILTQTHNCLTW